MRWKGERIPSSELDEVLDAVIFHEARKAVKYLSPSLVVTAAGRHRPDRRARTTEVFVTIGAPNFAARRFIKAAQKAGEPFPIKKVQLRFWPTRKQERRARQAA